MKETRRQRIVHTIYTNIPLLYFLMVPQKPVGRCVDNGHTQTFQATGSTGRSTEAFPVAIPLTLLQNICGAAHSDGGF